VDASSLPLPRNDEGLRLTPTVAPVMAASAAEIAIRITAESAHQLAAATPLSTREVARRHPMPVSSPNKGLAAAKPAGFRRRRASAEPSATTFHHLPHHRPGLPLIRSGACPLRLSALQHRASGSFMSPPPAPPKPPNWASQACRPR